MTHFDNLLRAAFDAGREWCLHAHEWADLETGEYVGDGSVPDFEAWRAGLSGLDLGEPTPIGPGDVVRMLDDDHDFSGSDLVVLGRCVFNYKTHWKVKHPNWDWPQSLHEDRLRKVSDAADR